MSKLVLIVEDSEICAETLQIALELIPGVEIRSIHSSRAAIALVRERDPDVIEGHNVYGFDLPYVMARCKRHNIRLSIGRDGSEPRVGQERNYAIGGTSRPYIPIYIHGRHVLAVMRYGDLNPVRAGMVRSPREYEWSSYRHYAYGDRNDLIEDEPEYLALGRTSRKRQEAYRHLFATPLASSLRTRRPDIVEASFYGDPGWVERHAPRAAGPPSWR